MSKRSAALLCGMLAWLACGAPLGAQRGAFPPGPMQEKAQTLCLACHDAQITVQQRLDRAGWTRVMDKMIRWGTPVEPPDRQPLIDYFTEHFGLREQPVATALAPGPGAEETAAACQACHDAGRITAERLDRRGWARKVDKMARWGAAVPAGSREVILDYLARNYGPQTKPEPEPEDD